ncbi:MAG: hypothetical protein DHS20C17_08610 [Cyclobacteriaceae bacterium]|nr:MAG: hypothetical protein DHS20C17_08610 [Cyclobacteriaceae bacterium]
MSSIRYLLLILLFFFQADGFCDPISSALKSLKKGKYLKVESTLAKSVQKNPVNPGAYYVYSLLYFDSTYTGHHLDSAHLFIERALKEIPLVDSLEGIPLEKASLTKQHLMEQKSLVDGAAFTRAAELNTVEAFQFFIDQYNNAPQLANAISRRDQLAFEIASEQNTYASYQQFIEQYPESHQVSMAQDRYDLLVFQSKTANGKLQHFIEFLEQHPNTPYRDQAEWQILQLSTLDDDPGSYLSFKRDYPESKHVRVIDNILYHLDKEAFMNSNQVSDSLKSVYALESASLIPIYENGKYGFIDNHGKDLIPAVFDSIPEFYLCQLLSQDVLQAFVDSKLSILSRNQRVLWDKPFDGLEDLGRGLLKISIGDRFGLLHKSGWLILEIAYQQIELLGNSFLAIQNNGKWGVASMTGRIVVEPVLSSVEKAGAFILLENNGNWGISNQRNLVEVFEQDKGHEFRYDDWELISSNYLMVFAGDKEGLFNHHLTPMIPLSEHQIHELDSTEWFVKTHHGTIRFYGDQLEAIPADRYQDFVSTSHYIGLLKTDQWEVWNRTSLSRINEISYDSLSRLSDQLMLLFKGPVSWVLFQNGTLLELAKSDVIKSIRDANQSKGFLQVTNSGKRQIYDLNGQPIYHTWYYDVSPLTGELFIIEKNSMKGIVDLQGKVLLKPRYQTVVADSSSHVTILHQGRFGYFNPVTNAFIKPHYESRLVYFDKEILVCKKQGKKGLINHQNKTLLPFEFDDIKQWSDSTVFALKENSWQVMNYFTGEVLYQNISGFEWIQSLKNLKAIVKVDQGYGLLDSQQGMLLNPGFNDIINLGTSLEPVYFTEKYIPEADYFVVIYYNQGMDVIRKQVFDSGNYDQVYCF